MFSVWDGVSGLAGAPFQGRWGPLNTYYPTTSENLAKNYPASGANNRSSAILYTGGNVSIPSAYRYITLGIRQFYQRERFGFVRPAGSPDPNAPFRKVVAPRAPYITPEVPGALPRPGEFRPGPVEGFDHVVSEPPGKPAYRPRWSRDHDFSGRRFTRRRDDKFNIRNQGAWSALLKWAEGLSELNDFEDALYESLPKSRLRAIYAEFGRQPSEVEKVWLLLKYWHEVSPGLALYNVVRNELSDQFWGRLGTPGKRLNQLTRQITGGERSLNYSSGYGFGDPAGKTFDALVSEGLDVLTGSVGGADGGDVSGRLHRLLDRT